MNSTYNISQTQRLKLVGALIGDDEKGYTGYFKQFPNVIAEGETIEETQSNLFTALAFYLDTLAEIEAEEKGIQSPENLFETELKIA